MEASVALCVDLANEKIKIKQRLLPLMNLNFNESVIVIVMDIRQVYLISSVIVIIFMEVFKYQTLLPSYFK